MNKTILYLCIVLLASCNENTKLNKPAITHENAEINEELSSNDNEDYKHKIIPGERLGTILINENATAVLDSLGKPDSGDAAMGKAVATWHEDSENLLSLYTTTKMGVEDFSRIKGIRTFSPKYRTDTNIGVNSSLNEIRKQFELKKVGTFNYGGKVYTLYATEKGIGFEIDENQENHGIVLTEQGTTPNQNYLTFYPDLKEKQDQ